MMTSLMQPAKTPVVFLLIAGLVMITAMATSKKAKRVIQTSVDLARQDEGDEMFGSSRAARAIVRTVQSVSDSVGAVVQHIPVVNKINQWINRRFAPVSVKSNDAAAFDVVRAAVNLVLASMLITIGTNYALPLSTTSVSYTHLTLPTKA